MLLSIILKANIYLPRQLSPTYLSSFFHCTIQTSARRREVGGWHQNRMPPPPPPQKKKKGGGGGGGGSTPRLDTEKRVRRRQFCHCKCQLLKVRVSASQKKVTRTHDQNPRERTHAAREENRGDGGGGGGGGGASRREWWPRGHFQQRPYSLCFQSYLRALVENGIFWSAGTEAPRTFFRYPTKADEELLTGYLRIRVYGEVPPGMMLLLARYFLLAPYINRQGGGKKRRRAEQDETLVGD